MNKVLQNTEVLLYNSPDGAVKVDVLYQEDTIWLTQKKMGILFNVEEHTITYHLQEIFKSKELNKIAVTRKIRVTAADGKEYLTNFYNLDAIIAVGYRVNSKQATQFRVWATQVLRDFILKGFVLDSERLKMQTHLKQQGIKEITAALDLLKRSLKDSDPNHNHISDIGEKALEIIAQYAKSWQLLLAYDENRLISPILQSIDCKITVEDLEPGIRRLKSKLMEQKEATALFGLPITDGIKGIFGNVHQTFNQEMLYPSVLERASHLFYFVIKDHPFVDGNKRIACFLLLVYLDQHQIKLDSLTNGALVALALLIAKSEPAEKDITLKLIENVIAGEY